MKKEKIIAFGLGTANRGEQSQLLGALKAIALNTNNSFNEKKQVLLPIGIKKIEDMRENFYCSKYKNYKMFKKDIFLILDRYFEANKIIPRVFVTVFNQALNENAATDADATCRVIKEYYEEHNLGYIFTTVLTAKYYKYKYVDLINIPKHLLTFSTRIKLLNNKSLKKKSLITVGTINNFSKDNVVEKYDELLKNVKTLKNDTKLKSLNLKLERFLKAKKHIVFCLGGRVEGPEISFDIKYAKKIFEEAKRLTNCGYSVIFVNGPRTPNNVTDFLFELCLNEDNIIFYNCKNIAKTDDERGASKWRIYSGKYENEFLIQQKYGNIYPGILGVKNTLVVHTFDSYSGCETTVAGIPTALSHKGLFIDKDIRYDCHNLVALLIPKYAIDWDEFFTLALNMKLEPKHLSPQGLSSSLKVYAEATINRLKKIL